MLFNQGKKQKIYEEFAASTFLKTGRPLSPTGM
jgi:hypothetical protein